MQEFFLEQLPHISLYYTKTDVLYSKKIKSGVKPDVFSIYNKIEEQPICKYCGMPISSINGSSFCCNEHKILYNEIYDVLTQAADSGAIYGGRSYSMWGNTIKYNYIHNIYDAVDIGVPVVGVFLDERLFAAF